MNLIDNKKSLSQNITASSPALRIQKNDAYHDHRSYYQYMDQPSNQPNFISKVENQKNKFSSSRKHLFKQREDKFK